MKSDIEIAQEAVLEPIVNVAAGIGATDDDIELYGASPYAVYEAPIPFSLNVGAKYNAKINGLIQAFLDVKSASAVTLTAPGLNMTVNGFNDVGATCYELAWRSNRIFV